VRVESRADREKLYLITRLYEMVNKLPNHTFSDHGMKIVTERGWFPKPQEEMYFVKGRKWSVKLVFTKNSAPSDHRPSVLFNNAWRDIVEIEITNQDKLEDDFALLRLFGVAHLFPNG